MHNTEMIGPSDDDGDDEVLLRVDRLVKSYGNIAAVRNVSFQVCRSDVFVIVGPNGSGKTSTVECIEGIREPDSGKISLMGVQAHGDSRIYNKLFGAQLQESSLPERIRIHEALKLFARYYSDPWDVGELLERIGFEVTQHRQFFDTLSGGQKRRVMLALALLGRPRMIILDEPTAGLDPHARLTVWNLIEHAIADGTTILMTTHDLAEAQEHATKVALFSKGKIVALGTPQELIHSKPYRSKIRVQHNAKVHAIINATDGCELTRQIEGWLYGFGDADFAFLAASRLRQEEPSFVGQLTVGPVNLEDIYMLLTTDDNNLLP